MRYLFIINGRVPFKLLTQSLWAQGMHGATAPSLNLPSFQVSRQDKAVQEIQADPAPPRALLPSEQNNLTGAGTLWLSRI